MMEPATKRRKTTEALADTDEDDELFLEPQELNQRRDPAFQLANGRARAATQLKSRFEDIFARYERDFTGIGDEIDLATGEVVVDNGHLSSMRSMEDWIVDDDDDEDRYEDEDDAGQVIPGDGDDKCPGTVDGGPRDPWRVAEPSWPPESESRGPPPLGSLLPTPFHSTEPSHSFPPFAHASSVSADPTWQDPELPHSAFLSRTLSPNGRHYGGATPVVTKTVLVKSLNAPESPEADEDDDLQTASGNAPQRTETRELQMTRESPLISKKFPMVDSSPQDNGLNDLIQDVIKNIPDTPPSIRRSRLPKLQGAPSPLRQAHRMRSKSMSNLRISDTPLHEKSLAVPRKRGRRPRVRAVPGIERQAWSTPGDQSSWDESDLESFIDVTSHNVTKPAGQILYVDIRAGSSIGKGTITAKYHLGPLETSLHTGGKASMVQGNASKKPVAHGPESTDDGIASRDHLDENILVASNFRQPRKTDKPKSQDSFQRNVVDPAFIFSDEETLLPKRQKSKRRQSEPVRHAIGSPPPVLSSNPPKQRTAGEHGAVAENRRISLAKVEEAGQGRMKNSKYNRARAENPMLVDSTAADVQEPGCPAAIAGASRPSRQRTPRQATDGSEAQDEQMVATGATKADARKRTHPPNARSRTSSQPSSPAIAKPSPMRECRPAQPATPQKQRSKRGEKTTPTLVNTSLMSLLSDSDDDEDEISFNHSDFTPSGHHRILVHRPFPHLATTPRFSTSTTNRKNKKKQQQQQRAGLPHCRSHSASLHRVSKTPRTPHLAGSEDGVNGSASRKQSHRKSHQLARSIVRVTQRRDSDDTKNNNREGSVVQTPGGSKRRCGVEGWKCERDFCFVCME